MRAKRLIIDLSPSRLALAIVQRSRIVRAHEEHLDPASWDAAWTGRLESLDAPLASALRAIKVDGRAHAQLTYRADSVVAEVYSSPAQPRAALDAARLALEAAAPFPLDENASSLVHLHRDADPANAQSHILALADSAGTLRTLTEWLSRAGLSLTRATPSVAYTIHHALTTVLEQPRDQAAALLLMAGHEAVFVAASPGTSTLHFVRQIPVGFESFLAPLTRPIARPAPQPTLQLTREQAADYLLRTGLPSLDADHDVQTTLTSREALPLLQPALQRLAVEIKQSLRFGLSDAVRQSATLVLAGRAIKIPNLEQRLADLTAATTRSLPANSATLAGGLTRTLTSNLSVPGLATPEAVAKTASSRLVAALYAGSAAASLLLVADAAMLSRSVDAARLAIDEAASQVSPLDIPDAAPEAREMASAIIRAAEAVAQSDSDRADWPALLADLSVRLPPSVRVHSVVATSDDLVAVVETVIASADPVTSPLQDAIAALRTSPLIRAVDLGPTARDSSSGTLRASLRVSIWPAPRQPLASAPHAP